MTVLVLPGIHNSGPGHWQTLWEKKHADFRRVPERDWDHPNGEEWVAALDEAVRGIGPETILAAHSLGCLQAVHWASQTKCEIGGALLVAPPDPQSSEFPKTAMGFSPLPERKLPFDSIVIASEDDSYAGMAFSRRCARAWGSRFVSIGKAGHINADSRLGDWPQGFLYLQSLREKGK